MWGTDALKSDHTPESSVFFFVPGGALLEFGESMSSLAKVKDSLDIDVTQNFIDPLQMVVNKDIKDIQVSPTGRDARREKIEMPP